MSNRFCNPCRVMTRMMTSAWGESAISQWSLLRRATLVRHLNASTYCCTAFSQLLWSSVALMVVISSLKRSSRSFLFALMGTSFSCRALSQQHRDTAHAAEGSRQAGQRPLG